MPFAIKNKCTYLDDQCLKCLYCYILLHNYTIQANILNNETLCLFYVKLHELCALEAKLGLQNETLLRWRNYGLEEATSKGSL